MLSEDQSIKKLHLVNTKPLVHWPSSGLLKADDNEVPIGANFWDTVSKYVFGNLNNNNYYAYVIIISNKLYSWFIYFRPLIADSQTSEKY